MKLAPYDIRKAATTLTAIEEMDKALHRLEHASVWHLCGDELSSVVPVLERTAMGKVVREAVKAELLAARAELAGSISHQVNVPVLPSGTEAA